MGTRRLIKVSGKTKVKDLDKVVEKTKYARRLSAYKGVVTRNEILGRSRFTITDNLLRKYPDKYKSKQVADSKAQNMLARYLLKHRDWIRRGHRGREPKFVSP